MKIDPDQVPDRPRPILDWGNNFLGSGALHPGFRVGGAVWQPALLAFGTFRTALQSYDDGVQTTSEWANRLDFFFNLQLSGTERLFVGLRPTGTFSGETIEGLSEGTVNDFNTDVLSLFFEGDFGELFPNVDRKDTKSADYGFSIGRQPSGYQDGMLIADSIDSLGVIENTLLPRGGSDLQLTLLYGWNDIHRGDNIEDEQAQLVGAFVQADFPSSTINTDLVYVFNTEDETDGAYVGLSSVQRIGHMNSTFRILASTAIDTESASVGNGVLLSSELSWVPAYTENHVYVDAFWGIDRFTSAARGPDAGGPLGRVGILFASVGIGTYPSPLSSSVNDTGGGAVGYQMFFQHSRRQLIVEVGGRVETDVGDDSVAVGSRFQQAIGRHFVLQVDGYVSGQESRSPSYGGRVEWRIAF